MKNSLYHLCPMWLLACLQGFVISVLLTACSGNPKVDAVIACADSLMASRPDSALHLLDSALHIVDDPRLRLSRLNAINKLDTVFTPVHVAQAKDLADHFDRHGTPNERMLAHYLLGRTFVDCGEAPHAIEAYNDAAAAADTTASDCDYLQLCIIYTQLGNIFYAQNLFQYELDCLDRAVYFGNKSNNLLAPLLAYAQKAGTYNLLMKPDSMLFVCKDVSEKLRQAGYNERAAGFLLIPITYLIDQGNLTQAQRYLNIYERESGYFDPNQNIESGREIYYYMKGYYYLGTSQHDSAEYYFRKELAIGKDFNNQNAGARGLALLYQQTHRPDSAAKYALYSYAMNDSVYSHKAMTEVTKMKSMYDYTLFEREAQQVKRRADQERTISIIVILLFVMVVVTSFIAFRRHRAKYQKAYKQAITKLGEAQNNLLHLKAHEATLNAIISDKADQQAKVEELKSEMATLENTIIEREAEIERQKAALAKFRNKEKLSKKSTDQLINQSDTYKHIRTIANQGRQLTDDDWNSLMQLVIQLLPGLYNMLSTKERDLTRFEYQICILERLGIEPRRMHYLLGISESYVSRIRDGLHLKIFGIEGDRQLFSEEIKAIC